MRHSVGHPCTDYAIAASWEGGRNSGRTVYWMGVPCRAYKVQQLVKLMAVQDTINKEYKVPQLTHTTHLSGQRNKVCGIRLYEVITH